MSARRADRRARRKRWPARKSAGVSAARAQTREKRPNRLVQGYRLVVHDEHPCVFDRLDGRHLREFFYTRRGTPRPEIT